MTFLLIPGRVALREKALGDGPVQHAMVHDASTLWMNAADMSALGIAAGDIVRVRSEAGVVDLPCQTGDFTSGNPGGDAASGVRVDDPVARWLNNDTSPPFPQLVPRLFGVHS